MEHNSSYEDEFARRVESIQNMLAGDILEVCADCLYIVFGSEEHEVEEITFTGIQTDIGFISYNDWHIGMSQLIQLEHYVSRNTKKP